MWTGILPKFYPVFFGNIHAVSVSNAIGTVKPVRRRQGTIDPGPPFGMGIEHKQLMEKLICILGGENRREITIQVLEDRLVACGNFRRG